MSQSRRALLAASALAWSVRAQGQVQPSAGPFPNHQIRLIVPFPAGGTTDLVARLLAPGMAQRLGQPVVIENRGGAGGAIGAEAVARAPADGHTLLLHNITFPTTTAALQLAGRATHDLLADFAPVSLAVNVPLVLLGSPAVAAEDLRGFVAAASAAQAAGTGFFYGSTGPGSIMNLIGEVLKKDAGLRMEHIPFRGAAPLVQEMLAGRIQLGGDQLSTSLDFIRTGALRGLCVLSGRRSPALPAVPTMAEQGLPALELEGWNGLFAPARTPPEVVAALQAAAAQAIRQPENVQRLAAIGADAIGSDTAGFATMVAAQFARIRGLVGDVRLRPD